MHQARFPHRRPPEGTCCRPPRYGSLDRHRAISWRFRRQTRRPRSAGYLLCQVESAVERVQVNSETGGTGDSSGPWNESELPSGPACGSRKLAVRHEISAGCRSECQGLHEVAPQRGAEGCLAPAGSMVLPFEKFLVVLSGCRARHSVGLSNFLWERGERLRHRQIAGIQTTVWKLRGLSRRELGHTICEHPCRFTPNGGYGVQACLRMLEQLEMLGILTLPAKRTTMRWSLGKLPARQEGGAPEAAIERGLKALAPLSLRLAVEPAGI